MSGRSPAPEVLDQSVLEEAARLLGAKFERPLAALLGPYHFDRPQEHLVFCVRQVVRPPLDKNGEPNRGWRPIPIWVWPALARLLVERVDSLTLEADRARALSTRLRERLK